MLRSRAHWLSSWLVAAALGVSLCGLASPATAQARPKVEIRKRPAPPQPADARGGERSLRWLSGLPVAKQLVDSDDVAQRIRGIARLGAIGTPEAIDSLLDQFEQGSTLARDPRTSLEAVRALAPHAARENVRQVLVREMTDAAADGRGTLSPLSGLAQHAAALALARSGESKALMALGNAVLQGGAAGETAGAAIRAYPPVSLAMLLEGRKRLSPSLATLLGDLGDLRALDRLRRMLDEPDIGSQMAAAVALAKLGDDAPVKMARQWLGRADTRLQRAAAEVLAYLDAPDAPKAIEVLLASDSARSEGLRLALIAPSPAFAKSLARAIPLLPEEDRATAVAALGRAGAPHAAALLVGLLADPDLSTPAAFALATLPGEPARHALQRAITSKTAQSGAARRLVLRAAIVRALELGEVVAGLVPTLEQMLATKEPADRAVAAFGLVSIGERPIADLLRQVCPVAMSPSARTTASVEPCDVVIVGAAARAALHLGRDSLALFMPLLVKAASDAEGQTLSPLGEAAGVALLGDPSGGAIATSQLSAWAESGGPLAPLAARALPMRDDAVTRGRIKRLLAGSDPVIRAHVALGLAWDREPDAVSLLAGAYRFEEDPAVRCAIVRALSQRREIQRHATLVMARDLDADDTVRSLARSALGGRALPLVATPSAAKVAWVSIIANGADAVPSLGSRAARIVRSDGLAFPVLSDPDGVLLVPSVPMGTGSLLLAPVEGSGDAVGR